MLCPNCNQQIPDKSKYCIKCGQRISQPKTETSPQDESLNESYRLLSTILASTMGGASSQEAIETLLKRGKSFLEEGEWKSADTCFDRVLDLNPEFAPAYIGKLCVELKVFTEPELARQKAVLTGNGYFEKSMRFAAPAYKAILIGYNQTIEASLEEQRKEEIYLAAKRRRGSAHKNRDEMDFASAAKFFRSISGYLDADALAAECDAEAEQVEIENEEKRRQAEERKKEDDERYEQAEKARLVKCKKRDIHIAIALAALAIGFTSFLIITSVIIPSQNYDKAMAMVEAGNYDVAIEALGAMGDYRDAKSRIKATYYAQGKYLFTQNDLDGAISAFKSAGDYPDAITQLKTIYYAQGKYLFAQNNFIGAIESFKSAGNYADAVAQLNATYHAQGESLLAQKKYKGAIAAFKNAGDDDAVYRANLAYIKYLEDMGYQESDYGSYPANTQYITTYELSFMEQSEIALIRNEIYARHGYIFQSQEWINYFNAQWWYTPNPNLDTKARPYPSKRCWQPL